MAEEQPVSIDELHNLLDEHGDTPTQRITAVLLVEHGVSKQTVADAFGVSLKTIYNWVDRFEEEPLDVAPFDDQRPGAPGSLEPNQKEELFEVLRDDPTKVGYDAPAWTPGLVGEYIRKTFGAEYSRRHVRRLMREAGLSYRTARPQHHEADPEEQAEFRDEFKKSTGHWTTAE